MGGKKAPACCHGSHALQPNSQASCIVGMHNTNHLPAMPFVSDDFHVHITFSLRQCLCYSHHFRFQQCFLLQMQACLIRQGEVRGGSWDGPPVRRRAASAGLQLQPQGQILVLQPFHLHQQAAHFTSLNDQGYCFSKLAEAPYRSSPLLHGKQEASLRHAIPGNSNNQSQQQTKLRKC